MVGKQAGHVKDHRRARLGHLRRFGAWRVTQELLWAFGQITSAGGIQHPSDRPGRHAALAGQGLHGGALAVLLHDVGV